MDSPDLSVFVSRLHLHGSLAFTTGMRIGASRSNKVDEPDLPVLRDAFGKPYIPGSSFKGALRSYIEAILRALQARADVDHNLACLSVGKPTRWEEKDDLDLCLTQSEIGLLKQAFPKEKQDLSGLPAHLQARISHHPSQLPARASSEARLDEVLRQLSCWTCRVFGASWLASKVQIRDLPLATEEFLWPTDVRDGVAIDRDAGRAGEGLKYQFEALAPGAPFHLEILVENASEAELGLLWLGLAAFERGEVQLGGAKSRGLGWCTLAPDWAQSRYVDQNNLLDALFAPAQTSAPLTESQAQTWVKAFQTAIRHNPGG